MYRKMIQNTLAGFLAFALVLSLGAMVLIPAVAMAATNQGTGDIAGVAADLTASNTFTLTTATLALVKRAFLASNGSAIADNSSLPKGTLVKFMIYINNNTAFGASDVSVRDILAATFSYQTGTLKVDNSVANCAVAVCTGAEEAAIFAAVNATAAKTDAVDADVVSITGATIDAGNQNVANGQLDIAASKVWALLFTVSMQ